MLQKPEFQIDILRDLKALSFSKCKIRLTCYFAKPFQRVHIDVSQKGKDRLVLVDSHSEWIDVKHMTYTTTERATDELMLICAEHGLPEQLMSDNGP